MIPVMANYDGRDVDDDHGHRMVVMIMVSVLRSNNINIIYNSSSGRAKSYSMSYCNRTRRAKLEAPQCRLVD